MSEQDVVAALRQKARTLYEGREVPHRSSGVALAEAFDRDHRPYQGLRRGGVTGDGECGAVVAGRLLLGEMFGYPDPTAPVSLALREAMNLYRAAIASRLQTGGARSLVCNEIVHRFPVYHSDERVAFCTDLVGTVAEIVADIAVQLGATLEPTPIRRDP
ncbi:MAG TPA: C-GCAxxG-C-C family protein [Anaeromyxobacteraceae bacterium]|nr:C-GCAxxG-C-C family protein [Anaeromyxobacteraceae bacterium]